MVFVTMQYLSNFSYERKSMLKYVHKGQDMCLNMQFLFVIYVQVLWFNCYHSNEY